MASSIKTAGRGTSSGNVVDWLDPGNITSSNNAYASVTLTYELLEKTSNVLIADYFYFDIPLTATINGIVCTVERYASSASTIRDLYVKLLKNGASVGDAKSVGTYWSTSEGSISNGSPTDLWGTTWSPSDINSLTTGFFISCEYTPAYSFATAYVDTMSMTVYYTNIGIKYGTTNVSSIYYGSTEIKKAYYGTTQIT